MGGACAALRRSRGLAWAVGLGLLATVAVCLAVVLVPARSLREERRTAFRAAASDLSLAFMSSFHAHIKSNEVLARYARRNDGRLWASEEPFRTTFAQLGLELIGQSPGAYAYGLDAVIRGDEVDRFQSYTTAIWHDFFEFSVPPFPNLENTTFPLLTTVDFTPIPDVNRSAEAEYITVVQRVPFPSTSNPISLSAINLVHGTRESSRVLFKATQRLGQTVIAPRSRLQVPDEDYAAFCFTTATSEDSVRESATFILFALNSTAARVFASNGDVGISAYVFDVTGTDDMTIPMTEAAAVGGPAGFDDNGRPCPKQLVGRAMPEEDKSVQLPEIELSELRRQASKHDLYLEISNEILGREWLFVAVGLPQFRTPSVLPFYTVSICIFIVAVVFIFAVLHRANSNHKHNLALARIDQETRNHVLSYMCHELRNPVHALNSITCDIRPDPTVDGSEESCKELVAISEQMSYLVDDFLSLSNTDIDNLQLRPRPCSLCAIVRDSVNQYRPLVRKHRPNVTMHLEMNDALDDQWATVDPVRLRQILSAGISNALRFTTQGSIVTSLTVTEEAVLFEIKDTGVGLARTETASSHFFGFRKRSLCGSSPRQSPRAKARAKEATRKPDMSWSRLSLGACRRIARLMGGNVTLSNRTDKVVGCDFRVTLPLSVLTEGGAGNSLLAGLSCAATPTRRNPKSVAIKSDFTSKTVIGASPQIKVCNATGEDDSPPDLLTPAATASKGTTTLQLTVFPSPRQPLACGDNLNSCIEAKRAAKENLSRNRKSSSSSSSSISCGTTCCSNSDELVRASFQSLSITENRTCVPTKVMTKSGNQEADPTRVSHEAQVPHSPEYTRPQQVMLSRPRILILESGQLDSSALAQLCADHVPPLCARVASWHDVKANVMEYDIVIFAIGDQSLDHTFDSVLVESARPTSQVFFVNAWEPAAAAAVAPAVVACRDKYVDFHLSHPLTSASLSAALDWVWDIANNTARLTRKVRVVACDDELIVHRILSRAIHATFHRLSKVYLDGLDVLEHWDSPDKVKPHILLLDIVMKHSNGEDIIRLMRERPGGRDIPIFAVTGNSAPEDLNRYESLGFSRTITKPYRRDVLVQAVSAAVQEKSSVVMPS